jgi:RNA polymerase sigma factor (sigma-70 family)
MNDLDHAGGLLEQVLTPHFPQIPPCHLHTLGRETWVRIQQHIRRQGLDRDHSQDVFQSFLLNVTRHLENHGAETVGELRAWLHAVARNATNHYLKKIFGSKHRPRPPLVSLDELLAGDSEFYLPAPPVITQDDDELERLLIQAIARLKGRPREFAERHFFYRQSAEEIKQVMDLPNDRAYKRLLRQTVKLLVDILKIAFAHTLASTWVA